MISRQGNKHSGGRTREPLVIVGIGCRFPGGVHDPRAFWDMLKNKRSGIVGVPENRWNVDRYYHPNVEIPGKMITKWGGFLQDLEDFDAQFFGITPREALRMDPQQRWLLEVAWEACEDAGIPPASLRGSSTGVFVGIASNDYAGLQMRNFPEVDMHTNSGSTLSIASNRIAYLFDLKGPAVSIDTACSSALVAVNLACQAVWSGECDAALAGGVNAILTPEASIGFSKASMLSPSGQCFAFDARANGYVRGEGAGMIMIKPLKDAIENGDVIYSVIRAAVINQDGNTSSMTVPGLDTQEEMLRIAYAQADMEPNRVAYMEAHGTGTPVGDPIETNALGNVLCEGRPGDQQCLIGSVKTNIGHLESGSGIAGLIKAALVLRHDTVPPNLNFETPNPNIPFEKLKLKVATELQPLPHHNDLPPVTAVNSFGFGGTNAHIVLEAAPETPKRVRENGKDKTDRPYVLPISARDEESLRDTAESYAAALADENVSLADFCYSAGNRRDHHEQRATVIGKDAHELATNLKKWARSGITGDLIVTGTPAESIDQPVFVFTGQGAQWWAMGQHLLEREPVFRKTIEKIDSFLKPLAGWSLIKEMTKDDEKSQINKTNIAQPAIFALQVALAELWKSWGIEPSKVIGHSVGEVAAAYCAGVYTLEDAVTVIYHRSRLQDNTGGKGRMVAVGISEEEGRKLVSGIEDKIQVAVVNSPSMITLAGDTAPLEEFVAGLEEVGTFHRWLRIDYAFHTHQMDPIKDELLAVLADINPKRSKIPFVSTVTGGVLVGDQLDGEYWWRNVRESVLFAPGLADLIRGGEDLFIELGPHPILASSIDECLSAQSKSGAVFHSLKRKTDESEEMLRNLSALHIHGLAIDWKAVDRSAGNYVHLPTYAWHHEKFWLESSASRAYRLGSEDHPLLGMRVPGAHPKWRFELDPRYFSYLEDHRFWDSIVFPASGYGEMGLALTELLFPGEGYVVEELVTKKALFISEKMVPSVEIVFDDSDNTYRVFSSTNEGADWELNAEGRLVKYPLPKSEPADLAAIRDRMEEHFTHEKYYEDYEDGGYQFGPNFQQLENVWRKPHESIAEIIPPDPVAETASQYRFHPAVLDACFHALKGAQIIPDGTRPQDHFYLPAAIRRIQLHVDEVPHRIWSHAVVTTDTGDIVIADLFVYDDQGNPVADILGFRCDRVEQKESGADDLENCYYQFDFEPCRLKDTGLTGSPEFPPSEKLIAAVQSATPDIYDRNELKFYDKPFNFRLEKAVCQYIVNAYLKLGWKPEVGEIFTLEEFVKNLGIIEQHHRLARAELNSLAGQGIFSIEGDFSWKVLEIPKHAEVDSEFRSLGEDFPRFSSESELQLVTGPYLAEILTDEEDPLSLLFPKGSSEKLERFYSGGADFPAYNELIGIAVAKAVEELPYRRALRVLEVGAGTGSLTRAVLPQLPADRTEYTFTDNGPAFLADAKKAFAEYSFVEYTVFDIEKTPEEQGIDSHSFDLILATNVIHATSDLKHTLEILKSCLASEGMLMFLEVTHMRAALDNVFGLLKGWWGYTDTELRPHSALLQRDQWENLLTGCGFNDIDSFVSSADETEAGQAVFIAFGPTVEPPTAETSSDEEIEARHYLAFADKVGVCDSLTTELLARGDSVIVVRPGKQYETINSDEYTIRPDSTEDIERLLTQVNTEEMPLHSILHFWTLDHPPTRNLTLEALESAQDTGVLSALALSQAIMSLDIESIDDVRFVSRGVQSVLEGEGCSRIASAPLTGLIRVANNENLKVKSALIDLDPKAPSVETEDLLAELLHGDGELEVAHRTGRRYVNRLHNIKADDLPKLKRNAVLADGTVLPYRLEIDKPGILTNLSLNETRRRDPEPGEIEVLVKAGGINFRDVMKALGMYPGNPIDVKWFGDDISGTVVRVGKNVTDIKVGGDVVGMAPYCFRSYVTVNRHTVFKKAEHQSFEEAATLPTVFLTTHYALNYLARMQEGESILIHAGTGGVGQAAIQIAKNLGLTVFSTAGTPEKRQLLVDMGVDHVLDSRTLKFADEIMEITEGRGIDCVLNSLAGEFIPKSFSVLAPFGRFLEIGKIDVYGNSKLGLEQLRNNISYFVIDLTQHLESKPEFVANMLTELGEKFEDGTYEPLPNKIFPITEAVEAFRYMAQGKHIGKNVLSFQVDRIPVGPSTEDGVLFRPDASYLITGGAGGFGLELAEWMAAQGARHLVLMSRSGPREDSLAAFKALRTDGVNVIDARGDVTHHADVRRVIDEIRTQGPPLRGVIHGAMVLDDEFIVDLTPERFNKVLHPKMLGAWNLHTLTLELPLDHFISFSSFSTVIGAVKQSNYNAGNIFLDCLSHHRHSLGLPALTFNWGALSGAGFVERNEKTAQYLDKLGMKAFSMEETLSVFRRMLSFDAIQVAASRVDWASIGRLSPTVATANLYAPVARRDQDGEASGSVRPRILGAPADDQARLVEEFIVEQVSGVFGTGASKIDRGTPLTNLGLDSLMAIELMNRIEGDLGINLPMGAVLNGPNIRELSIPVLKSLLESSEGNAMLAVGGGQATPFEISEEELTEFPLSEGQRSLWFLHRFAPDSPAYNLIFSAKFRPLLDIEMLKQAFASLYERHPMLDVTFAAVDGQPVQRVHKGRTIDFREHDTTRLTEDEIKALLIEHANQPFNLEEGPVVRLEIFRTNDDAHITLLSMHHIVSDAWSVTLVMNDLMGSYFALNSGKTPKHEAVAMRYHDFVAWEQKHLQSEGAEKMAQYWNEQLADVPVVVDLPTDRPRPAIQTFNGNAHGFKLDEALTTKVTELAADHGATLFTTLLSGFEVLLHRYCNQDDLLIGSPLAGRNQSKLHGIVGYFINPVVLRSKVDDDPLFTDFLTRNGANVAGAIENQQHPISRVIDQLKVRRDPSRSPLFQVSFSMERIPGFDERGIAVFLIGQGGHQFHVGDLTVETVDLTLRQAQFEITLVVEEAGGNIYGCWQYNSDLFDAETIAHLNDLFAQVLEEVAKKPNQHISEINLLPKKEETRLLETCNATTVTYPKNKFLHQLVAEQATKTPSASAMSCGEDKTTFAELDAQANGLASWLRDEGVGPDVPVALLVNRSADMVVGSLGILKAGGCYVPMDPDFPAHRLEQMLTDAAPGIVVTQGTLTAQIPEGPWKVYDMSDIEPADEAPVIGNLTPDSLAYIIYTSGSTGTPKGVEIPNRAAVNFLTSMQKEPGLDETDRLLAVTTLSFDISLLELYLPLISGAETVIATREEARDVRRLATLLDQRDITVMQATPATWQLLLDAGWEGKANLLVLCGGEAMPRNLANTLVNSAREVWNLYGPTETTVWSTCERVYEGDGTINIGRPIANTTVYVLDEQLKPVPVGFVGDLYIGGEGLARGYHGQPELTAEKFVEIALPTGKTERLYKTGDLARWRTDEKLECLGRSDFQIKLRGVRMELEDIESQLESHDDVSQAVVIKRDDVPGGENLVAYLIAAEGKEIAIPEIPEIREHLAERLPDAMRPAFFQVMESFPKTPNQKIDRMRLPLPSIDRSGLNAELLSPQTPSEKLLWDIFSAAFENEQISIRDNFFEIGGDSLLAVRILLEVGQAFNRDVPVEAFLRNPTIEQLARYLHHPEESAVVTTELDIDEEADLDLSANEHLTLEVVPRDGKSPIPQIDAVALTYIPDSFATLAGITKQELVRDWFKGQPLVSNLYKTSKGSIGVVMLPCFELELYKNENGFKDHVLDAINLASKMGAKTVSLTGVIPSATDSGKDILEWTRSLGDTPVITTGDATRAATIVKSVEGILEQAARSFDGEHLALVGLGSIGTATLDLLLEILPHPKVITLCDPYQKAADLEAIRNRIVKDGYKGDVRVVTAQGMLPAEVYEASLIVGSTNLPGILDVKTLHADTLVVDYSFPPIFRTVDASRRLEAEHDILFTTGGQLKMNETIEETLYLPEGQETILHHLDPRQLKLFVGREADEITGCVLVSLLTGKDPQVLPTVGPVKPEVTLAHYKYLETLGITPARLQMENYFIDEAAIEKFRERDRTATPVPAGAK